MYAMDNLQRTTFFIDKELHKKLKAKLALDGMTITLWLRKQIREFLHEY